MNAKKTFSTSWRILSQLKHDHRTVALIFAMPVLLMGMVAWILVDYPGAFDHWGPWILGIFPLTVMFLVTSVATLRERLSGTLERVLLLPIGRADLLGGYAVAFGLLGVLQALLVTIVSFTLYGMEVSGSPVLIAVVAIAVALLGMSLGLAASAVAATEFQAVQMMPAIVFPQLFLCGILVPRDSLPTILEWLSWAMPLSYAIDAINAVTASTPDTGAYWTALVILVGFILGSLTLGALTLRRTHR